MAYECPGCEGKGEYIYDPNLGLTTCEKCGGEGEVDTRVFCAECGCHEYRCECEEPDFYEDKTLIGTDGEDSEDIEENEEDSGDDGIDVEDTEQDSEQENNEDW